MLLVTYLVVIFTMSHVILGTENEFYERTNVRNSNEYVQSFNKFTDNLRQFFAFPFDTIEHKRMTIKKAFHNFISEVEKDSKGAKANAKTAYVRSKSDLIALHGFKLEYHTVTTTDGYILTLHRILPVMNGTKIITNKVALLHHGLLGSSSDWIILGPTKALPYLLLQEGYDVWLANARGSKYSRSHISKPEDSTEFWDFSFHEIGKFDLSATIDYIRVFTESKSKIDFIGHSMGATALLVLLSSNPRYNLALRSAIFLGPLAFMRQVKGPLRLLGEYLDIYGADSLSFLGEAEFMALDGFPRILRNTYCNGDKLLCMNNWLLLANGGQEIPDVELKSQVLRHVPSGASTKTVIHYCQLVTSGEFRMFDWAAEGNIKKYRKECPPLYRLHQISIPVAVFSSDEDWLSTTADVLNLLTSLPNVLLHDIIRKDNFSHTDFVWSQDATQVYYKILEMLSRI